MKRLTLLASFCLLMTEGLAAASEFGVLNFDFIAPSVTTTSAAPNQVGLVVYDIVNKEFVGRTDDLTSPWKSLTGGGVNPTLSNLDAATSINSELNPDSAYTRSIGSAEFPWNSVAGGKYGVNSSATLSEVGYLSTTDGEFSMPSGSAPNAIALVGVRPVAIYTRNRSNNTRNVHVETGNSSAGTSGDIQLRTGTAGTTRGSIKLDALFVNLPSGTSDPTATAGSVYYNTTSNKMRIYNGTTWMNLCTSSL